MSRLRGMWRFPVLVLVVAMTLPGCGPSELTPITKATKPRTLYVAAASDLQTALPQIIDRYLSGRNDLKITPIFGASGQLTQQVEAGAPIDLFLSANTAYVERLAKEGNVDPASVRPYAIGSLVLIVADSARGKVLTIADLARPDIRHVAIANPETAPYGNAARRALESAALMTSVRPKLAIAESVRQALQFVETGNAEAGFVGRALVRGTRLTTIEVDPELYPPIVQSLGIVARTNERVEAEAFARFLLSESGRQLLEEHGFALPPASPVGG